MSASPSTSHVPEKRPWTVSCRGIAECTRRHRRADVVAAIWDSRCAARRVSTRRRRAGTRAQAARIGAAAFGHHHRRGVAGGGSERERMRRRADHAHQSAGIRSILRPTARRRRRSAAAAANARIMGGGCISCLACAELSTMVSGGRSVRASRLAGLVRRSIAGGHPGAPGGRAPSAPRGSSTTDRPSNRSVVGARPGRHAARRAAAASPGSRAAAARAIHRVAAPSCRVQHGLGRPQPRRRLPARGARGDLSSSSAATASGAGGPCARASRRGTRDAGRLDGDLAVVFGALHTAPIESRRARGRRWARRRRLRHRRAAGSRVDVGDAGTLRARLRRAAAPAGPRSRRAEGRRERT